MFAREGSLSEIAKEADIYHNFDDEDLTAEEYNIRTDIEIAKRSKAIYFCNEYPNIIQKKYPDWDDSNPHTFYITPKYYAPGFFIRQKNRMFNVSGPQLNTLEGIQLCERKIKEYDFDPTVFRYINDIFDTCDIKAKHKYNQLFILHNLGLI